MKMEKFKRIFLYSCVFTVIFVMLLIQLYFKNYRNVALCCVDITLILLIRLIVKKLRLSLPFYMEIIICLFILCSQILGEIGNFYEKIPTWDDYLHFVNGFVMCSIGVSLFFIICKKKLSISPLVLCFAFCFSMTIAVFWEFGEFFLDVAFHSDCQKDRVVQEVSSIYFDSKNHRPTLIGNISETHIYSNHGKKLTIIEDGYLELGIYDTMSDLFINFIACLVYLLFSWFDHRRNHRLFQKYFYIRQEK